MPVCQARLKALYISKAAAQVAADLLKNLEKIYEIQLSVDPQLIQKTGRIIKIR